jgi:hypothetical protein
VKITEIRSADIGEEYSVYQRLEGKASSYVSSTPQRCTERSGVKSSCILNLTVYLGQILEYLK